MAAHHPCPDRAATGRIRRPATTAASRPDVSARVVRRERAEVIGASRGFDNERHAYVELIRKPLVVRHRELTRVEAVVRREKHPA